MRFGRFELWPDERQLLADEKPTPLGARAFDLLCALVDQRERVLTKSELLERAWPGRVVEENNLSVQISTLRRVLGADAIATVPGYGYRFTRAIDTITETPALRLAAGPDGGVAAAHGANADADAGADAGAPTRPAVMAVLAAGEAAAALAATAAASRGGRRLDAAATGLAWATHDAAHGLLLAFDRPRAALGAAALLHAQGGLRIGIVHPDDVPGDARSDAPDGAPSAAAMLAQRAQPGQTLFSAGLAADVIPQLDGEPNDEGAEHPGHHLSDVRVFSLATVQPSPYRPPMPAAARPLALRPTLAVLPFNGYAQPAGPMSLGDILTDQVISTLSRSDALHVISRLSTLAFRDRELPLEHIAGTLAAHYVVSGRHWTRDGRIHVSVELAEAAGGQVLWSESVADLEDAVLQPDSTLVQAVVAGVMRGVFVHELRMARALPLPDLASHTLLLSAISMLYRLSQRDFTLAHQALDTLRERAPRHPAPLAWLARWHLFRVVQRWSDDPRRDGRDALDLAQRALDLDPDSALALTMLGNVHTSFLRDLDRAEMLYDQALSQNPNESLAWLQKGNALSFRGDGDGALHHTTRAVALSPLDPSRHFYLGIQASAALTAEDYPRAVEAARAALRMNHAHLSAHRVLVIALAMSGRLDEARASARRLLSLDPTLSVADYVAQSPGAASGLAERFGQALLRAGVPADPITTH